MSEEDEYDAYLNEEYLAEVHIASWLDRGHGRVPSVAKASMQEMREWKRERAVRVFHTRPDWKNKTGASLCGRREAHYMKIIYDHFRNI